MCLFLCQYHAVFFQQTEKVYWKQTAGLWVPCAHMHMEELESRILICSEYSRCERHGSLFRDSSFMEIYGLAYIAQVMGERRKKDKGGDAAAGAGALQVCPLD